MVQVQVCYKLSANKVWLDVFVVKRTHTMYMLTTYRNQWPKPSIIFKMSFNCPHMWTLYIITYILHKGDGIFILGLVLLDYGQLTKRYSVTVLINNPPPQPPKENLRNSHSTFSQVKMIKKITWQFSPYRSVIFSNTGKYLQEVLGNEEQNQLQVFFPRKKLLQVYKQEFHQVCEIKIKKKMAKKYPQVNCSVH